MSARYLLDCPCGKEIIVDSTQAGEIVQCECGQQVEVPTLLKLRTLEMVEEPSKPSKKSNWGVIQGMTIAGGFLTLAAGGALIFFLVNRPVTPDEVFPSHLVDRNIGMLSLPQVNQVWFELKYQRFGDSRPADDTYRAALKTYSVARYATVGEAYRGAVKQFHIRIGVTLIVLALAALFTLVCLILGIVQSRKRRRMGLES